MTDLVSLIKEAIMNAPTRSFDGKMNYQGMAEAAAKAVEKDGWRSPDYIENILWDIYDHNERKET